MTYRYTQMMGRYIGICAHINYTYALNDFIYGDD